MARIALNQRFSVETSVDTEDQDRQRALKELQDAKNRYYREYDDPVKREENYAWWKLLEASFKLAYSSKAVAERQQERNKTIAARQQKRENDEKVLNANQAELIEKAQTVLAKYDLSKLKPKSQFILKNYGVSGFFASGDAENVIFEIAKERRLAVVSASKASKRR